MAIEQLKEERGHDRRASFNQAPRGRRVKEGLRGSLTRFLFGDDIFISYSRRDSTDYALTLANELTRQNLSCYIDQWGTPPGEELPESLKTALRRSTLFVIVGTERATVSEAVSKEVTEFLNTERTVIPISFEGSLERAEWFSLIRGLAIAQESSEALGSARPSEPVISRIINARGFIRRNARLRNLFWSTALLVVLLLAAGAIAASAIVRQTQTEAEEAGAKLRVALSETKEAEARAWVADQQAVSASERAQIAENRTILANQNASKAEARAADASERAREAAEKEKLQRRIASSIQLANESSRTRDTTAESLMQSSLMSLDSVERYPTAEGSHELRNNLALMPRRILSRSLSDEVVAISPDARHLAIQKSDGNMEIQLTDTGQVTGVVEPAPTGSGEVIKEPQTRSCRLKIDGPTTALSNEGKFLATIRGSKMRVHEVAGDQRKYREVSIALNLRGTCVLYGFAISPDGKYLATVLGGISSGNVQVWSVEGGQMVVELSDDESQLGRAYQGMKRVAFSAKGNYLAATGENACLWEISGYSVARPLTENSFTQIDTPAQNGKVYGIAPGPDDRSFAASSNETIRIWKKRTRNRRVGDLQETARIPAIGSLMAFSADGERLYVASRETLQVWETSGPWEIMHMQHSDEIQMVAFRPEGHVTTISGDSRNNSGPYKYKVKRWSIDKPNEDREIFKFEIKYGQDFALTNDGKYLVLTGFHDSIEIWELSEPPSVRRIRYPTGLSSVDSMTISPDGQYIALIGKTGRQMFDYKHDTVVIYPLDSEERFATLVVDDVRDVSLSARSEYLLTDQYTNPVVWDVRTGRKSTLQSIENLSEIRRMQFSAKGKYLAVATRSEIYLLEAGGWRVVAKIQHRDLLKELSFSHDDRYLGTVNSSLSARVWETATGTRLASLDHVGQVNGLAFSTDGKYVVTTHDDTIGVRPFSFRGAHFLRLSLLQPRDLADELCKRLRLNFSAEKWKQYAGGHPSCSRDD